MPAPVKTIHVKPGSELDQLLEDAADTLIELEQSGVRYRLIRVTPPIEPEIPSREGSVRDSILNIIGIGASEEEMDVGRYKREYLAEAFESTHET
jgi:hypothetical protein